MDDILDVFSGKKKKVAKNGVVRNEIFSSPSEEEREKHKIDQIAKLKELQAEFDVAEEAFVIAGSVTREDGKNAENMTMIGGTSIKFMVKTLFKIATSTKEMRKVVMLTAQLLEMSDTGSKEEDED